MAELSVTGFRKGRRERQTLTVSPKARAPYTEHWNLPELQHMNWSR